MNKLFNVLVLLGLPVASSACAGTDVEESDATGLTSGEPERQPEPPGSATAVSAASSAAPADPGAGGVGPSPPPEPPVDPATDPSGPLAEPSAEPGAEPTAEPTLAPTHPPAPADAGTPTSTPDCPAEQWTCESLTCSDPSCSDCAVWQEPMGCSCDPARPRQASDCAADEKFVCDTLDAAISQRGRVSCACVDAEASPRVACAESNPPHQTTAVDEFLCSCAWILIR